MKHITTFILALCFSTALPLSAQTHVGFFGQYSVKYNVQTMSIGPALFQSFSLDSSSYVTELRLGVFTRYYAGDHPATLSILSGDGAGGEVLLTQQVNIKGLNKFYSDEFLAAQEPSNWDMLWYQGVDQPTEEGTMTFDDVVTSFPINAWLPAGQFTVALSLDTSAEYAVNNLVSICARTNCFGCVPVENSTYSEGSMYRGYIAMPYGPNADMAFEVRYLIETPTSVEELNLSTLGDKPVTIFDLGGQLLPYRTNRELQEQAVPGVYIVTYNNLRKKVVVSRN